jgi:hypothetical protein
LVTIFGYHVKESNMKVLSFLSEKKFVAVGLSLPNVVNFNTLTD